MPLSSIHQQIIDCKKCTRLRDWCEKIAREKRKSFKNDEYWGKPVPAFGDHDAQLLIVGLAPAAHGANRTGRMFTGDNSGLWLYRALFEHGFANKETSVSKDDDLKLNGAYITAAVHCAPPDNKPTPGEMKVCMNYLGQEIEAMKHVRVILALGSIAWDTVFKLIGQGTKPKFGHGAIAQMGKFIVVGSYHPSQQNTFTKRLTKPMFDDIFRTIKQKLNNLD